LDYKDQTNSNGYIEFPALVRNVPYKWCKAEDPSNVYADADSLTVWVSLT